MLFLQQNNKVIGARISFEFSSTKELLSKINDKFPKMKYVELKGEVEETFYPINYTYEIYLTTKQTKKGKAEVFGRLLSETKADLETIKL